MAKFYVRSGELERIVIADTQEDAAYKAVCRSDGEELDVAFYIDERGFRGPTPNDESFNTDLLPSVMLNTKQLLSEWEND